MNITKVLKVTFQIAMAIIISLVGLVIASLPSRAAAMPGQADTPECAYQFDYSLSVGESMCWPLQPRTTVVIQGPVYMWGMRRVATYVDKRVDRLSIISRVGVKCADYPWAFCLKVHKYRFTYPYQSDGRMGEYRAGHDLYDGTATFGDIGLNTAYNDWALSAKQYVAGHELLHALGMQHHQSANGGGVLAQNTWSQYPSNPEITVLKYWYELDNTN